MDTRQAVTERRSVKHYDSQFRIPEAEVRELLELAVLSPTSFNIQNWRVVRVNDPEKRAALHAAAWNQGQVRDASEALVICADLKAFDRKPERYWVHAPQPVQDALVPMIRPFYEGNERLQRDEAMRSAGMLAQTIMLVAKDMGYDSNPMIGFDPDAVAQIVGLPEDHVVCMMVVVGKAARGANPRGGQLPVDDVVFENSFA